MHPPALLLWYASSSMWPFRRLTVRPVYLALVKAMELHAPASMLSVWCYGARLESNN